MDKLIYLFLLLILFVNSINTKIMLVSIFCFVGICVYYKKHHLLIVGLIILYILSLSNQTKKETFTNNLDKEQTIPLDENEQITPIIKDKYDEVVLSRQTYSKFSLILFFGDIYYVGFYYK